MLTHCWVYLLPVESLHDCPPMLLSTRPERPHGRGKAPKAPCHRAHRTRPHRSCPSSPWRKSSSPTCSAQHGPTRRSSAASFHRTGHSNWPRYPEAHQILPGAEPGVATSASFMCLPSSLRAPGLKATPVRGCAGLDVVRDAQHSTPDVVCHPPQSRSDRRAAGAGSRLSWEADRIR